MKNFIVTKITGKAYIEDSSGHLKELHTGDSVPEGAIIHTSADGSAELQSGDGNAVTAAPGAITIVAALGDTPPPTAAPNAAQPQTPHTPMTDSPSKSEHTPSSPDSETNSFVSVTRTAFGVDHDLHYASDVNTTAAIDGRATLNPRIKYTYTGSVTTDQTSYNDDMLHHRGGEEPRSYGSVTEPVWHSADSSVPPTATPISAATPEDTALVIDPASAFSYSGRFDLTLTGGTAQHGTVTIENGKLIYTPDPDYNGHDEITITAKDDGGRVYSSSASVEVSPVQDAFSDSISISEKQTAVISPLANDTFKSGAHITSLTDGKYGTCELQPDGTVIYRPYACPELPQGASLEDDITYTVTTAAGNQEKAVIHIVINGENDAPTAADDSSLTTSVPILREDTNGASETQGNVLMNDTDPDRGAVLKVAYVNGEAVSAGTVIHGTYGDLTINADGSYRYDLNNNLASVQSLTQGERAQDTFSVTITDEHGATANSTLTMEVEGTGDTVIYHIPEDSSEVRSGSVLDAGYQNGYSVIEAGQRGGTPSGVASTGSVVAGKYGTLIIHTDGSYSYYLDQANADLHGLAEGETGYDQFTVYLKNPDGLISKSDVFVQIDGMNEAPVLKDAVIQHLTEDAGPNTASGVISSGTAYTDADYSDTHTAVFAGTAAADSPIGTDGADIRGTYGTLHISPDGSYTYTIDSGADNPTLQALKAGEQASDIFTVKISDGHSGFIDVPVTIDITGTNDAPTAKDFSMGTLDENSSTVLSGSVLEQAGAADPDHDARLYISSGAAAGNSQAQMPANDTLELTGQYGTLTVYADGHYIYTLDPAKAAPLDQGEKAYDSFTVKISDGAAETSSNISVEINGLETAAIYKGPAEGSVKEDTTTEASGKIGEDNYAFTDQGAVVTITQNTYQGDYGTLTVDSDGSYSYNLGGGDKGSIVNSLGADAHTSDIFYIPVTGTAGGASQIVNIPVIIKISGTNDAPTAVNDEPTIDGSGNTSYVTARSADLSVSGNVLTNDSDPDTGDVLSVTSAGGSSVTGDTLVAGTYGTLTIRPDGSYTYTLNSDDPDTEALGADDTAKETFAINIADGHGGSASSQLVIDIKGTNEAPVLKADAVPTDGSGGEVLLKEDDSAHSETGIQHITQNVNFTDADTTDTNFTVTDARFGASGAQTVPDGGSLELHGTYGTLTVNSDGSYSYQLDKGDDGNGNAVNTALNSLAEGETADDIFTVTVSDGHAGGTCEVPVVIKVTGTNDAPVAGNIETPAGAVTEDVTSQNAVSGNLLDNASDPDNASRLYIKSVSYDGSKITPDDVGQVIEGKYGTLTVAADGTYTYHLDNTKAAVQALNVETPAEETFIFTVSDSIGAESKAAQLIIHINGTDDAPVAPEIYATRTGETSDGTITALVEDQGTIVTTDYLAKATDIDDAHAELSVTAVKDNSNDHNVITPTTGTDGLPHWAGTYGTLTQNAYGKFSYALDNSLNSVQRLSEGEAAREIFIMQVSDDHGECSENRLVFDITGKNDEPVLVDDTQIKWEDSNSIAGSNIFLNDSDVDDDGTLTVTGAKQHGSASDSNVADGWTEIAGQYGTLRIAKNGDYEYVLDNTKPNVQALAQGTTTNEVFDVSVFDGHVTGTEHITIAITGQNDAPTLVNAVDETIDENGSEFTSSGSHQLTFGTDGNYNDVDTGDTHSITRAGFISNGTTTTGTHTEPSGGQQGYYTITGDYGALKLYDDGSYSYNANNSDRLAAGENAIDSFTATITDNNGASVDVPINITINGKNDAPVATDDNGGSIDDNATAYLSGNVLANDSDIDHYAHLQVSKVGDTAISSATEIAGTYGTLKIDADGNYTYHIDPAKSAYLKEGESAVESFQITVSDGQSENSTDTSTLSFTIVGQNEAPQLISPAISSVKEDAGTGSSCTGAITHDINYKDADNFDPSPITQIKFGAQTINVTAGNQAVIDGKYGTLTINSDGSYSYAAFSGTLDPAGKGYAINGLAEGELALDTFTATITDGSGASAKTLDIPIIIKVTGTNDAPIAANDNAGTLTEDATSLLSGNVVTNDSDPDQGAQISVKVVEISGQTITPGAAHTNITGTYGTLSINQNGDYVYTLNNSTCQSLSVGDVVHEDFTVTITDEHGSTSQSHLYVNITGQNDTPTLIAGAANVSDAVKEDTDLTAVGQITYGVNYTDVDTKDIAGTFSVNGVSVGSGNVSTSTPLSAKGTYGTLTMGKNGTYTYTLDTDAANAKVKALAEGEHATDVFSAWVYDQNGAYVKVPVTISVTGTNDAPTAKADTMTTLTEDYKKTTSGNVLLNDIDSDTGDTISVSQAKLSTETNAHNVTAGAQTSISGKYGTLLIGTDGKYTYTLNDSSSDLQALQKGQSDTETFNVTIKDNLGLTSTSTLKVTINGTNDSPVISIGTGDSAAAPLTETNTGLSAQGTLTLTDVDTKNTVSVAKTGLTVVGDTRGLLLSQADLLNMLTVQSGNVLGNTETSKHFTWNFSSGTEAFNYLAAGQILTLTYTVLATDSSGVTTASAGNQINTSNAQTITITITGTGDSGSPVNVTTTATEDASAAITGNLLKAAIDQGITQDGYVASFKYAGETSAHDTSSSYTVLAGVGRILITPNGDYSFIPNGNFSGPVDITYTTSAGGTATLHIDVTPVADAPIVTAASDSGAEDTAIALNLTIPQITDNTDQNGALPGDHPERLGYISLNDIEAGAVVKSGGNTIFTGDGSSSMMIVIVADDGTLDTNLHYSGADSLAGIIKLTESQYKALTITPPQNSAADMHLTLEVKSYEVDDSGVPNADIPPASSSAAVDVAVTAVTDITSTALSYHGTSYGHLTWNEDMTCTITKGSFDTTFNNDNIDTDGSEAKWLAVSGLARGTTITAGGSVYTAGADGTVKIPCSADGSVPDLVIQAPPQYSGSMSGVQFALCAQDIDPDFASQNGDLRTSDPISFTFDVSPVADGVKTLSAIQAKGAEDTQIHLDIRPSSVDPSETFNVKISGIPTGAKIYYNGIEQTLSDGSVTINNFDTSKLYIQPPQDYSGTFQLYVNAQSVNTAQLSTGSVTDDSQWWTGSGNTAVPLTVKVIGVADEVHIKDTDLSKSYTEAQAETTGIKISDFVVKSSDDTDGSERVSIVVTNLADGFSVVGGLFIGGTGTSRQWLVQCTQQNGENVSDAYIKTPENYSGQLNFSINAISTERDGGSCTSGLSNVAVLVTPTPESTLHASASGLEDTPFKLDLSIANNNGDANESLAYIKINSADITDGKYTLKYSEDGITFQDINDSTISGITGITKDGEYYKIDASAADHIYAQGSNGWSGNDTLSLIYAITDKVGRSATDTSDTGAVTTEMPAEDYALHIAPVTDKADVNDIASGDFTMGSTGTVAASGTADEPTATVTLTQSGSFTLSANVTQTTDTDGSEHLVSFVINGVPDGIRINGGTYYGDPQNGGKWIVTASSSDLVFSSTNGHTTVTAPITFTVDAGSDTLHALTETEIKITAITQDTGATSMESDTESFFIKTDFGSSGGSGGSGSYPACSITFVNGTVSEDQSNLTLYDLVKASFSDNNAHWFTLSISKDSLPDGASISGWSLSADGKYVISGYGNTTDLQSVLQHTVVTLPKNFNDNNASTSGSNGTQLNISWTVNGNGTDADGKAYPSANGSDTADYSVTPVTDPVTFSLTASSISENQTAGGSSSAIDITAKTGADGNYAQLQDGKLYIKAEGSGWTSGAALSAGGTALNTQYVSGVNGLTDGSYYVLSGTSLGALNQLSFTPDQYASGSVALTVYALTQEAGAATSLMNHDTLNFDIAAVNSGYSISATASSGMEDGAAKLALSGALLDQDGSETALSAVITGFSNADNFSVSYGTNGAQLASKVQTGTDASGNPIYGWSVTLNSDGTLPDIYVNGMNEYSGTEHLTVSVVSGENSLDTSATNTAQIDVTFNPVAQGVEISPSLTFNTAASGTLMPVNLNASLTDTDGSETLSLKITGVDGARFYDSGTLLDASHVSWHDGAYWLTGIAWDHAGKISMETPLASGTAHVEAWTIDSGAGLTAESAHTSGDFTYAFDQGLAPKATDGNDTIFYYGQSSCDGGSGTDTVYMPNYHTTDHSTSNNITFSGDGGGFKNIEAFDLTDGNHSLTALSVKDVLSMTDSNHMLTINADSGDSIGLTGGSTALGTWSDSGSGTWSGTLGADTVTLKIATASGSSSPAVTSTQVTGLSLAAVLSDDGGSGTVSVQASAQSIDTAAAGTDSGIFDELARHLTENAANNA